MRKAIPPAALLNHPPFLLHILIPPTAAIANSPGMSIPQPVKQRANQYGGGAQTNPNSPPTSGDGSVRNGGQHAPYRVRRGSFSVRGGDAYHSTPLPGPGAQAAASVGAAPKKEVKELNPGTGGAVRCVSLSY